MTNANLFSALRAGFPKDLEGCAIETDSGQRYSWRELEQTSARLANLLQALPIAPNADGMPPRIAVQVDKSVQALMLYLATLRTGFVFLPLNTAYQQGEMAYFIDNARPAVVVCSSANLAWVEPLAQASNSKHVFTLDADGSGSLMEQAAAHSSEQTPATRQPDELAAILYTSGTTGRSKGAMLSHGNLLSNAQVLKDYWGWQPGDVLIHTLPIFHVHGLFVAIHGALLNGSTMLWHSKFDPAKVIADLPRASIFMGVPTLYVRMLADPALTWEQTRHMRLFISGSAPLLLDTFEAWQERTGHTILERYGMSETTMLTSNPYGPDARYAKQEQRRGGTVGFPLPGVQLRVHDQQGQPVAPGEVGNIQVKGPNVFAGYWQMPEKTREEFTADGFFITGDVGLQDQDGYVTIVGRNKDLIISGGYNVYPAEIEAELNALEGVAESAVVGVPHPDFGEVGIAVIIARPGASPQPEALLNSLKSRLANYKIPKQGFVAPELPRNTMGKVQKNLLRERYQQLFQQ